MLARVPTAGIALLAAMLVQGCDDGPTNANRPSRIVDARSDFVAGYVGARNPDMDVVRAEVSFDGTSYEFRSTMAGALGTTPGALYVWGVNRGAGTARFDIAPGVLFDAVVVLRADGTGSVRDLVTNTPTDLPAGSVTVSGAELRARVPAALLVSRGFAAHQYTVNFWPRLGVGNNNQISDFAPDNSNVPVRDVR